MIRFSALLVALAIGLLVAGVVASSLLLVYVSIAVCAVAALLLAAGVLWHWSEIFGSGEARPASPAASGLAGAPATTPVPARPVPASPVPASGAAAGMSPAGSPADRAAAGRGEAHPVGAAYGASDHGASDHGAAAPGRPAEPAAPQVAQPVANRPDDLWERVNEELESAGKRDTGALTWPAAEFTAIPQAADEPGPGAGEELWPPAAVWQPPANPQLRWPTLLPPPEPGRPGRGRAGRC